MFIFRHQAMKIDNKISPFLTGPYLFFAFLFFPGLIFGLFDGKPLLAAISFVAIWYLLGTFEGIEIDTGSQKFRKYNKQFGLFKTGRWRSLDEYIGVTLVPMRSVQRMYSRSNRVNESTKNEFRVYLVNKARKPAVPIKRCKTMEEGQRCLDEFAIWLKMPVFSPR